jgi:hypothetical protein
MAEKSSMRKEKSVEVWTKVARVMQSWNYNLAIPESVMCANPSVTRLRRDCLAAEDSRSLLLRERKKKNALSRLFPVVS